MSERYKAATGSGPLLVLLCGVLVIAPLPLGSNRPWAWPVLAATVFMLVIAYVGASIWTRGRPFPAAQGSIFVFMGAWLVYNALYLLPVPPWLSGLVSPGVADAYQWAADSFPDVRMVHYLTIDHAATLDALIKYLMLAATLWLVVALVTTRARLRLAMYTILGAGVIQVVLALGARTLDVELTPRELMDGHWNVLRGTFVNRNHFSAFLAMTAASGLGILLAHLRRGGAHASWRARLAGALENVEGPVLVAVAGLLVVGAGMVMSTSRGGIAALGCAILVMLALSLAARGRGARELLLAWPLGAAAIGAIAWPGSRHLLERLLTSGFVIPERWMQWAATRELIADHLLLGTGPGTYQYAFTAYKEASFRPLLYDHAHNDYLQVLAEHGIVGGVLLSVVVVLVLSRLLNAFFRRHDVLVRGALFASLTGMLAMLIHSLVEFNFQIPANALYFWTLAGIGLAATRLESRQRRTRGQDGNSSFVRPSDTSEDTGTERVPRRLRRRPRR